MLRDPFFHVCVCVSRDAWRLPRLPCVQQYIGISILRPIVLPIVHRPCVGLCVRPATGRGPSAVGNSEPCAYRVLWRSSSSKQPRGGTQVSWNKEMRWLRPPHFFAGPKTIFSAMNTA
jgi:hypothetical protein